MRLSLVVAALLVGLSATGVAQQQKFKVKHTPPDKTRKTTVPALKSSVGNSGGANSKDLQALEHQTAKSSAPRNAGKKSSGAAAIKPIKDKPNPPINLGSGGSASGGGGGRAGGNPYKGRLKQKYGRQ